MASSDAQLKSIPRHWLRAAMLLATILFVVGAIRARAADSFSEYKVKALFLYNFAKYVDWPASVFPSTNSPIVIGIIGADRFEGELDATVKGKVERENWPDGHVTWALTSKLPLRDENGKVVGTFGISKDITDLKMAEEKLDQIHKQLVEASRQAGMAEVATSVLHNVGNVLNSINISSSLISDKLVHSRLPNLRRAAALLGEHEKDLADFLTRDSRGRQLPGYFRDLAEQLIEEQKDLRQEAAALAANIVHVKEIVSMQQNYARSAGVREVVQITELVEDSLRMNDGAIKRHDISVCREYANVAPILTERHKVLQILVNLIRNAKYACDDSGRTDKQITLQVAEAREVLRISVIDNGVGIPAENLTRIFNHGFTTRKEGHGFGLHSGALAARELGGRLQAFSDGPNRGATFTLELPVNRTN